MGTDFLASGDVAIIAAIILSVAWLTLKGFPK